MRSIYFYYYYHHFPNHYFLYLIHYYLSNCCLFYIQCQLSFLTENSPLVYLYCLVVECSNNLHCYYLSLLFYSLMIMVHFYSHLICFHYFFGYFNTFILTFIFSHYFSFLLIVKNSPPHTSYNFPCCYYVHFDSPSTAHDYPYLQMMTISSNSCYYFN